MSYKFVVTKCQQLQGTQDEVALKYISKETTTEEERETILDEVQILRSIRHPNVVAFYEFFEVL